MVFRITRRWNGPVNPSKACLTLAALLVALCAGSVLAQQGAGKVTNLDELRQQRKKAAHRERRIIMNNDGGDFWSFIRKGKEVTPEEFLKVYTAGLAGTQVDAIAYCTSRSFGRFMHGTKVGEDNILNAYKLNKEGKLPPKNKLPQEKMEKWIEQKMDPLQLTLDFCHKNNMELIWSMRMNDTHDGGNKLAFSKLKQDHPEYLMGSKDKRPKRGSWTAIDYTHQDVRDLTLAYFREVCENYDVDGVEFDFFRHPFLFKRHAMGEDCGQEELDMMTDMFRRIREMTERVGLKRSRPIIVGARVPDSIGYSEAIGLDIVRWLEEGLIDFLVAGGDFRLNPWEKTIQLGHKYDVPVYPCLSYSWMPPGEGRNIRQTLQCYRARATNMWDAGADGVYFYNYFKPHSPLWREVGDPKTLEPLEKFYFTRVNSIIPCSIPTGSVDRIVTGGMRFFGLPLFASDHSAPLEPGKTMSTQVRVGQHVSQNEAQGLVPEVKLRLRVKDLANAGDLSVKLNGRSLGNCTRSDAWLEYPVSPALVTKGTNRLEVTLKADSKAKPVLQDLLLGIRYKKNL